MTPEADVPVETAPAVAAELSAVGFWVRAGAAIIDGFGLWAIGLALAMGGVPGAGAFGVLAQIAYNAAMIAACGQTVGKMAAGAKVVRMDGAAVTAGHAVIRALMQYVSGILLGLGYVIAAFTPAKRALHDYVAGTRVIYVPEVGGARKAALATLGVLIVSTPIVAGIAIAVVAGSKPELAAKLMPGRRSSELLIKSAEGATKGNLGSLRAAASIYYGDHEGVYPARLEDLLVAGPGGQAFLQSIPQAHTKDHGKTTGWESYGDEACGASKGEYTQDLNPAGLRDTGRWGYVADANSKCYGQVFVDCTHSDTKGKAWYSF